MNKKLQLALSSAIGYVLLFISFGQVSRITLIVFLRGFRG